jgi:hypothetical protein
MTTDTGTTTDLAARRTPDATDRGARLAAAGSAAVFLLLAGIGGTPTGPPVETATAAQIRAYLEQNDTSIRAAALGTALLVPTLLVFTAALARLVRNRLPGSLLADLVIGAGVLVVLRLWLSGAADAMTLVQRLDRTDLSDVDDATLRGWYGTTNFMHFFSDLWAAPIAVLVVAFSLAALRGRLVARWLAWAGLVVGASAAVGTVGVAVASRTLAWGWFGGLFGWVVWTVAVGAALGIRAVRTRRAGS